MSAGKPRVAVVGGGPAGLTAAWRLLARGAVPVVFEARDHVGGRMRTDAVGDYRVDAGAQLISSSFAGFFHVLRAAGAEARAVRSPGRDALWSRGRPHEVVYGSPGSLLASGALPLGTKVKMGAVYLPFLHRHADDLELHDLGRAAAAGLDGESVAAWGERQMGRDFVDMLAYPILATLYGALPEETSAGFYHALSRQGVSLEIFALRGGAAGFCEALADVVRQGGGEVRCHAAVESVATFAGGGVEVSVGGARERFDAAVVASPAPVAREMVGDAMPEAAAWLGGVRTRATVVLGLLLDRPAGVRWFGCSFARGEGRHVSTVCVEENKGPGLVPAGRGLVVVFPSPETGERLLEAEPRTVVDTLLPETVRALPGVDAAVERARVYRWPHGWTLFRPGYLAHLNRFRGGEVEGGAPIALAGEYLVSPTVEGAVISGWRAAERVLGRIGAV